MDEMSKFKKTAVLGEISGQPLCQEYRTAWRKCGNDKEMMVRLALMQQSIPYLSHACYENLGLTKEYILENFDEYINGKKTFNDVEGVNGYTYQLYVGYEQDFQITSDVTGVMWTKAQISLPATLCPTIYVSNYSDLHLTMDGFSSIRVYLFDESNITIDDCDETCDVYVYKYSNRANVEMGKFCLGKVKIFNKQLKL